MVGPYERYEAGELVSHKKIILALWQQCKDDGLTVGQAYFVLDEVKRKIERDTQNVTIPSPEES